MIIFNSDLDNTLIYSYKKDIGKDKKCVEIYQDREICFMTEKSFGLLKEVNELLQFVPTTTRTLEQYKRIDLGLGIPKYALVCNGGVLLINGERDEEWYNESIDAIRHCEKDLNQAIEILDKDINRSFEIRFLENLFVFTKSEAPEETVEKLKQDLNNENIDVFNNGTKVYVVPKVLNKGNAILKLKNKLGARTLIAAGDSEFDVPMLNEADIAFAPKELERIVKLDEKIKVIEDDEIFSDRILSDIIHRYK